MSSPTEITVSQLSRLIGTPDSPILIDVRIDEDFAADPQLLPTAIRHPFNDVAILATRLKRSRVVIYCQQGKKLAKAQALY